MAQMTDFRQHIAARHDEFLELIQKTEAATGMKVEAQLYKRPKPADDPRLEPYFAWKTGIGCIREEAVSDAIFGRGLAERAKLFLEQLTPIYDYFNRFKV